MIFSSLTLTLTNVALAANRDLERRLTPCLNLSTQGASWSNQSAAAAEEFRFQIRCQETSRNPFNLRWGFPGWRTEQRTNALSSIDESAAVDAAAIKASHRLPKQA
jgi:hypothetical protein